MRTTRPCTAVCTRAARRPPWAERRARQQAREAERFARSQNYDNVLQASGAPPPGDPEGDALYAATFPDSPASVTGRCPVRLGPVVAQHEHEHEHADYAGGTHHHVHAHDGDASHQPGDGHAHPLAAAGWSEAMTDDDLYQRLFGD